MAESMLLKAILEFDAAKAIKSISNTELAFGDLQKNMSKVGQGVQKVGGAAGSLGMAFIPLTFGMGLAVNSAAEFGRSIAMIQTIADEAQFPVDKLRNSTLALGLTYGTAPTAQAEALYFAISSGADTSEKAMSRLNVSNKLAVAGGAELTPTLQLMGTIMNTYGKQGLSAAEASDVLFQSTNYGIYTVSELASSMGDVVPTAASLGLKFNELNAAMATVTLQGATAGEAATGLNMALVNVLKPTMQARKLTKELGLEFNAEAVRAKGLAGFVQDVIDKTGGSEEAMTTLFGSIMGFRVMMKLAGGEGKLFNEVLGKMAKTNNDTEVAFQKMTNTASFQLKQINALRQSIQTVFGQILEPALVGILKPLGEFGSKFVEILVAAQSGNYTGLGETSAAIAQGFREGIDSVVGGVKWLIEAFRQLSTSFSESFGGNAIGQITKFVTIFLVVGAALSPLLLGLAGIGFVIPTIITAVSGLISIFTGLFGVIIGPIGIILALLYVFRDEVAMVFDGVLQEIGMVFGELWNTVVETFSGIMDVFNGIGTMLGEMTGSIGSEWVGLGKVIVWTIGAILTAGVEMIGGLVKGVGYLIGIFVAMGDTIGKVFANIYLAIMSVISEIAKGLVKAAYALGGTPSAGLLEVANTNYATASGIKVMNQGREGTFRPLEETGREQARATAEGKAEEKSAIQKILDEINQSSKNTAEAAKSSKDAAEAANKAANKPTKVNVDGREVARSNAKAQDEIKVRAGTEVTPWQRRLAVEHGAIFA